MSYYMRFIQTDDEPITLEILNDGLKEEDPEYSIDGDGRLCFTATECAEIDLRRLGDGLFEEDIRILRSVVERSNERNAKRVMKVLEAAQAIVAVHVLWLDREPEETLEKIDPLWRWLFSNRCGLVQADAEGFYERSRRILAVE